jgi:hypothetical protein
MTEHKLHPLAAIFPKLPEPELQALAADIEKNGLRQSIRLDHEGRIVDGRNRELACLRAGVKPRYKTLDSRDDPWSEDELRAYIAAANIHRRHLTGNQKAAFLAELYPEEGAKGGRGHKGSASQRALAGSGVSASSLRQARSVRRQSPDKHQAVLRGELSLDQASGRVRAKPQKVEALDADDGGGQRDEEFEALRQELDDLRKLLASADAPMLRLLELLVEDRLNDRSPVFAKMLDEFEDFDDEAVLATRDALRSFVRKLRRRLADEQ